MKADVEGRARPDIPWKFGAEISIVRTLTSAWTA